jgi:hypothetical protein
MKAIDATQAIVMHKSKICEEFLRSLTGFMKSPPSLIGWLMRSRMVILVLTVSSNRTKQVL